MSYSLVFVVVGMYNLILLISSICLFEGYEETAVLQNVLWKNKAITVLIIKQLPL